MAIRRSFWLMIALFNPETREAPNFSGNDIKQAAAVQERVCSERSMLWNDGLAFPELENVAWGPQGQRAVFPHKCGKYKGG